MDGCLRLKMQSSQSVHLTEFKLPHGERKEDFIMYRILTEDVDRDAIFAILDSRLDGYTVTPCYGIWKGKHECSLAIDITGVIQDTVTEIAEAIRDENKQECVLVVKFAADCTFV